MDTILNFKEHLMTGANPCSPVTAKNYIADVKNFIQWFESKQNTVFDPNSISINTISEYKAASPLSASTIERHVSSLRKYFNYLAITQKTSNPFLNAVSDETNKDQWNIKQFKNFLYNYNSSPLTIKNYTIDVMQFLRWLNEVSGTDQAYKIDDKNIYKYINQDSIEEYKFRLQAIAKLSPASINRKLSSLRKYVAWAVSEELMPEYTFSSLPKDSITDIDTSAYNLNFNHQNISTLPSETIDEIEVPDVLDEEQSSYSKFPPLRLIQRIRDAGLWVFDLAITTPLAKLIDQVEYTKWTLTGKNIFTVSQAVASLGKDQIRQKITEPLAFLTPNFKKSFYAPLSISTKWLPLHKKLIHHLKHTRPKWYRIYHSYAIVHYTHLGLLILALSISGYIAYDNFTASKENLRSVLAGSDFTRMLNYKGRLTDSSGSPITEPTAVKFALYSDPKEKGPALIWQEVHNIKPDTNGNFVVSLGQLSPLSQSLFLQNEKIYLGIKVGENPELIPRQQIPTSSYASNADGVQGLRPITDPSAGEKNALLALDSLGNLTIGGTSSPIFQATGGVFTISGSTLLLSTTPGTDTDIVIAPDGIGKIDIQKSIQNSTEDINSGILSGAVTVEDSLAIVATSSGDMGALYINQNGNAPLISAHSGGTAKFVLEYSGNLGLGTTRPPETLLQVADGNDGYGGTITAKDGGAILMASNGTPPLTIGNNTDGLGEVNLRIFPTGEIDYNNSKNAEPKITLPSNKSLFISGGKGITIAGQITPANDSFYDLGSKDLKWNKIYVNEIITNGANGTFGHIALKDGIISPSNISNDFVIGGNSTSSAKFQVIGSGPNAGSLTTSGTITFSGATPKLIIKSNSRFDIETFGPADSEPTPKLSLLANGNLGIGTTTPLYRLDLQDNQNNSSVTSITNLSTSANAGALSLKLGNTSPGVTNSFVTFINGNGQTIGSISANLAGDIAYTTTGSDFAEYFKKSNPYEVLFPGDVVCLNTSGTVSKCAGPTDNIVGVVSGQAGFVGNSKHQNDPNYVLIGLIGQLPVIFSSENGNIEPGDPLSIGSDGKAVKATLPGQILGRALQGSKDSSSEKINVFITLTWHDPKARLMSNGLLDPSLYNSIEPSEPSTTQLSVLLVKSKSIISDSVETTLLNATDITTQSLTVAGKSLNEYILEKIAENLSKINATEINSPIASINSVYTDLISPLAYDSEIALGFRKQILTIENTKSKKTVAQIDNDGNARFAGDIEARRARFDETVTAQDASIAGTLRAGKLQADELELPESALAKLRGATPSATYVTNVTNVYQATPSASQSENENIATSTSPQPTNNLGYVDSASLAGSLAYIPDLKAKFASFEQGLMSFGPTSMADLSVAGQLSINGALILADNTINVLGQDLELQPLRQGNLSIMSGKVKIDTDGNMNVEGDANFAKSLKVKDTLFTRIISPLADSDLIVKLNKSKENAKASFIIQDASGSARFSVNDLGEVIASGAARFAGDVDSKRGKFEEVIAKNINVIRSVQADTSVTETIATASAGTATINRLQKERTILSPYVKEDSLIYITPISDTAGLTPYIARQAPEDQKKNTKGSFTIQVTKATTKDIKVNWWIIN